MVCSGKLQGRIDTLPQKKVETPWESGDKGKSTELMEEPKLCRDQVC